MRPVSAPVLIVGAGPSGCSCALWLAQMGVPVVLIEQGARLLPRLHELDLPQNWVLGEPLVSTRTLAERYEAHVQQQVGIDVRRGVTVQAVLTWGPGAKRVQLSDGCALDVAAVVLATGLCPVPPPAWVAPDATVLDAMQLTVHRPHLPAAQHVLLLGGGDNAVENAHDLCRLGHHVTLWSRGPLRAQAALTRRLDGLPPAQLRTRIGLPMPRSIRPHPGGVGCRVDSAAYGEERFDRVAVLFGFRPDTTLWRMFAAAAGLDDDANQPRNEPQRHLFVAGDAAQRAHPCIQTALGDGVQVARTLARTLGLMGGASVPPVPVARSRVLQVQGLRLNASVGILASELECPQPIQVDAALCLGQLALLPDDDAIHRVLDYRKVRQIVVDTCTAEHVNLLETLVGRLAQRLLLLPGVEGVRVRVAKLEIFDDCQAAIQVEAGIPF